MNPQPLPQAPLAAWIDAEGIEFQARKKKKPWLNLVGGIRAAARTVSLGYEIRLAPGALNDYYLPKGTEPCNIDNLPADKITEEGKYRATTKGDSCMTPGIQVWIAQTSEWVDATWINQDASSASLTYRVPLTTPFPNNQGELIHLKGEHTLAQVKAILEPAPASNEQGDTPGEYGEPWEKPDRDVNDFGDVRWLAGETGSFRDEAEALRATACWSACQGIADPVKAIQAAREALTLGLTMQRPGDIWSVEPLNIKRFLEAAHAALAQLNGRAGE